MLNAFGWARSCSVAICMLRSEFAVASVTSPSIWAAAAVK
jgi:hypothetical protein